MTATVDHWDDLGDGRVRVYTRTPLMMWADVTMSRSYLGTETMYAMLEAAARRIDKLEGARRARAGLTDWGQA